MNRERFTHLSSSLLRRVSWTSPWIYGWRHWTSWRT